MLCYSHCFVSIVYQEQILGQTMMSTATFVNFTVNQRRNFSTYIWLFLIIVVVVVAHIYPPVTGQRQTLKIGRFAHFLLQWLLGGWRNPDLLRSFRWFNVPVNFFEFLSTEFAACSKPPIRDNHCKAFYPRMQQRDQDADWTGSCDKDRRKNDAFTL